MLSKTRDISILEVKENRRQPSMKSTFCNSLHKKVRNNLKCEIMLPNEGSFSKHSRKEYQMGNMDLHFTDSDCQTSCSWFLNPLFDNNSTREQEECKIRGRLKEK